MNKVFFDLEWNTGFLDGNSFDEIIEIGAVKTDEEYRQIDGFRRLIRPCDLPQDEPVYSEDPGDHHEGPAGRKAACRGGESVL